MKHVERFFKHTDRYEFDSQCTEPKGWAQINTGQDASYFGTWCNPFELKILTYCEGDVGIYTFDEPGEFASELRTIKDWNIKQGWSFYGIDALWPPLLERFQEIGCADLIGD